VIRQEQELISCTAFHPFDDVGVGGVGDGDDCYYYCCSDVVVVVVVGVVDCAPLDDHPMKKKEKLDVLVLHILLTWPTWS